MLWVPTACKTACKRVVMAKWAGLDSAKSEKQSTPDYIRWTADDGRASLQLVGTLGINRSSAVPSQSAEPPQIPRCTLGSLQNRRDPDIPLKCRAAAARIRWNTDAESTECPLLPE